MYLPSSCFKAFVVAGLASLALPASSAVAQMPSDIARYLAGQSLSANSPLAKHTQQGVWRAHSKEMNLAWSAFERDELRPVREFARANVNSGATGAYYLFSGPDFTYVDAFFPKARVYILCGLEPIGDLPKAPLGSEGLQAIRSSLRSYLRDGYFKTEAMRDEFSGIATLLYVLLGKMGKNLLEADLISLDEAGRSVNALPSGDRTPGLRLVFDDGGVRKELFYFTVDLSDNAIRNSGFLEFCRQFAQGAFLLKSASYLLHRPAFSSVRELVLQQSLVIVQDDSGLPARYLSAQAWDVRAHGRYQMPTRSFRQFYQTELASRLPRSNTKLKFKFGYLASHDGSHVIVANRKTGSDN